MSILKTMLRQKPATALAPQVAHSELQAELEYWQLALKKELARYECRLTPRQSDPTLVPGIELITTIQSESKANPLLFISSGMQAAVYYLEELRRAGAQPSSFNRILEFGVGFARILRHFEPLRIELYGCDVTKGVIDWCESNMQETAEFLHSEFDPPLPYPSEHFDFVYANSVFTHLQHEQTVSWIAELRRIVRPDGYVISTHYDINEHLRGYPASRLHEAWTENGCFEWGDSTVRENNICYSPDFLTELWSQHFDVLEWRQYPLEQAHLVCRAKV